MNSRGSHSGRCSRCNISRGCVKVAEAKDAIAMEIKLEVAMAGPVAVAVAITVQWLQ